MRDDEHVVFLHGLGNGPDSWQRQIQSLPAGFKGVAPTIPGLSDGAAEPFSFRRAAAAVVDELDSRGIARAHICGLSLGAMIGLQLAAEHPGRLRSLTLSGGQVRAPRGAMILQQLLFRVLPARMVVPTGSTRTRMLQVMRAGSEADFRGVLAEIAVPTLVLCGSEDKPNLPAARSLAEGIPGAVLQILDGGHVLNADNPSDFDAALGRFLVTVSGRSAGDARRG